MGFFSFSNVSNAEIEIQNHIYKTRGDYFNLVPVGLSEDKAKVISYPWPGDIFYKGKYAYPTKLNKDYLLDNSGMWIDTAFLSINYDDYSQLRTPSAKDLIYRIKDNNPFVEFYDCESKKIEEINKIIDEGKLGSECKTIIRDSVKLEMSDKFGEDFSDKNIVKNVVEDVKENKTQSYFIAFLISFIFGLGSALYVKMKRG